MMRDARAIWFVLELVLVLSLLAANMQCLARCVTVPCHRMAVSESQAKESKLPPCHRGSSEKKVPEQPCRYSILVADAVRIIDFVQPLVSADTAVAVALGGEMWVPDNTRVVFESPTAPLPPPALQLSTVLRL